MTLIRAFVAITLPSALQRSLELGVAPLREAMPGVSWVKATNLHLTLKFLGDVEDRLVGTIATSLTKAAAEIGAFDLTIHGLGAFPTPARPQVIWVGASGPRLGALVESIEHALEPLGFPRERRPFSGHITLGRVRARANRGPRRDMTARGNRGVPGEMSVAQDRGVPRETRGTPSEWGAWAALSRPPIAISRIVLMRSQLSALGASYTELAEAPLAPPP